MKVAVDILPGVAAGVGRWQRETVRVLANDLKDVANVKVFAFQKRTERPQWVPASAEYCESWVPGRGQAFLTNRLWLPIELVCGLGQQDAILSLNLHLLRARAPIVQGVADVSWRSFSGQYRTTFNSDQIRQAEQAISGADHIITLSRGSADHLVMGGIPADRITVAYLGVGDEFRNQSPAESERIRKFYGLADRFVLYVGGINERKNIRVLIAAMERFCGAIPLVLAGPQPSEPLAYWGLDRPWVRHLGYIPESDVPGLYAAATVKVFPSKLEGFGLPLVEAMAAGTPVIAADIPVFREVGEDAACFFPPDDPDCLFQTLTTAFKSVSFREEYRCRGRELASRRTWQKYGESLVRALQVAVRQRR